MRSIDTVKAATQSFRKMMDEFLALESAGGVLLVVAAILAMICANSPLSELYLGVLDTRVAVIFGALQVDKTLLLWINDGMMPCSSCSSDWRSSARPWKANCPVGTRSSSPAVAAVGDSSCRPSSTSPSSATKATRNGWAIPDGH